MKTKLETRTPAVVLALIAALTIVSAVAAHAADKKNGGNPPTVREVLPAAVMIDPTTGLPIPAPRLWKDPDWKDPDKVLKEVIYDGLPLEEIARDLRKQFGDAFDVLIPSRVQERNWPDKSAEPLDPQSIAMKMQLKNVTASEVFNAMNLMFETENTPLRWELTMNGKRPTAVLRVLPALAPPQRPPEPQRMIYFVGELLGDEKSGMTMEQLVKIISEVYEMSYPKGNISGHLQFHKPAQLLIATGTVDQIRFVEQTIAALKQKAELAAGIRRIPGVGSMLTAPVGGGGGSGSVQKASEPKANAETKKTP